MGGGKTPQTGWMIATSGRGQDSPLDKLETWNSEGRRGIAPIVTREVVHCRRQGGLATSARGRSAKRMRNAVEINIEAMPRDEIQLIIKSNPSRVAERSCQRRIAEGSGANSG
jgi:hypothetical protein